MRRKPTKNTRGPNNAEKKFMAWCKQRPCIISGAWGVVVHHCEGATFKHNKVLIGHWFVIPLCLEWDDVVTHGSRKRLRELSGHPQSYYWKLAHDDYMRETGLSAPQEVIDAIEDWDR